MLRPPHPRLDGNAAAGPLSEIFGRDMSLAEGVCRHCGGSGPLAQATAELDDAGVILLCRGCGHTLLTYVHVAQAAELALPGLSVIRWADPV